MVHNIVTGDETPISTLNLSIGSYDTYEYMFAGDKEKLIGKSVKLKLDAAWEIKDIFLVDTKERVYHHNKRYIEAYNKAGDLIRKPRFIDTHQKFLAKKRALIEENPIVQIDLTKRNDNVIDGRLRHYFHLDKYCSPLTLEDAAELERSLGVIDAVCRSLSIQFPDTIREDIEVGLCYVKYLKIAKLLPYSSTYAYKSYDDFIGEVEEWLRVVHS